MTQPMTEFSAMQERIDDCAEHLTATRERLKVIRARLRELKGVEKRQRAEANGKDAASTTADRKGAAEAEQVEPDGEPFSSGPLSEPMSCSGALQVNDNAIRMVSPSAKAGAGNGDRGGDARGAADEAAQVMQALAASAAERDSKRRLDKCIRAFNIHPAQGLRLMEELKLVEPWSARGLGALLCETKCLNKAKLGNFFGDSKPFNVDTLNAFCEACPFRGLSFEAAVRVFLQKLLLPTESMKVDQVLTAFARAFCDQNPGTFSTPGVVHVLAFSLVMLNHDAHGRNGDRDKLMSKEQFVVSSKGVDQGKDLPRALLEELYDSVLATEIKCTTERSDDGALFTNPLREGFLRKQGGIHMGWAKRWFILCDHTLYYFKDEADIDPKGFFPLENVNVQRADSNDKQIELVPRVGSFLKSAKYDSSGQMVTGNHRKCLLRAGSTEECTAWIAALNDANRNHDTAGSSRGGW